MHLKSIHPTVRLAESALLLGIVCSAFLCGCSKKTEQPAQTIVENNEPPVFPAVPAEAKSVLEGIYKVYSNITDFNDVNLEAAARAYAKENGLKAGQIFHPVRVAVSGRTHGPTLFKMLEYMGKDTVLARIQNAVKYCK